MKDNISQIWEINISPFHWGTINIFTIIHIFMYIIMVQLFQGHFIKILIIWNNLEMYKNYNLVRYF